MAFNDSLARLRSRLGGGILNDLQVIINDLVGPEVVARVAEIPTSSGGGSLDITPDNFVALNGLNNEEFPSGTITVPDAINTVWTLTYPLPGDWNEAIVILVTRDANQKQFHHSPTDLFTGAPTIPYYVTKDYNELYVSGVNKPIVTGQATLSGNHKGLLGTVITNEFFTYGVTYADMIANYQCILGYYAVADTQNLQFPSSGNGSDIGSVLQSLHIANSKLIFTWKKYKATVGVTTVYQGSSNAIFQALKIS